MSQIKCPTCDIEFNAEKIPLCPNCLATEWKSTADFIKEKHDPKFLPKSEPSYRSVLSWEFVNNIDDFTEYATCNGTWYFSNKHGKYCHFTNTSMFEIPGSGTQAGNSMPDHTLDGLLVADADTNPHAYAVEITRFQSEITSGDYTPLPKCNHLGCENLTSPGKSECLIHET
ncbi:hypothetical protein ACFLZT_00515 [Thermodesulfobacteriota bacterium]